MYQLMTVTVKSTERPTENRLPLCYEELDKFSKKRRISPAKPLPLKWISTVTAPHGHHIKKCTGVGQEPMKCGFSFAYD